VLKNHSIQVFIFGTLLIMLSQLSLHAQTNDSLNISVDSLMLKPKIRTFFNDSIPFKKDTIYTVDESFEEKIILKAKDSIRNDFSKKRLNFLTKHIWNLRKFP
jgi:hypothetical protein